MNPQAISPTASVRPGLEPKPDDPLLHRGCDRQRREQHRHAELGLRQRRGRRRRGIPAERRDGRFQRQARRHQRFRGRRRRCQCHRARQAHALVDDPDHRDARRAGHPRARLAGRLTDLHGDLPGVEQPVRLRPLAGAGGGRAARAPSAAAEGHDLLRLVCAVDRRRGRRSDRAGLRPGRPGMGDGRRPGDSRHRVRRSKSLPIRVGAGSVSSSAAALHEHRTTPADPA